MSTNPGITAIIIRPSGEILIMLRDGGRNKPIPFPYKWYLPSGMREEGEQYEDTLVREMQEEFELFINLKECEHLMEYNFGGRGSDHVFVYHVEYDFQPKPHEGAGFGWVYFDGLRNLSLAFNQEEIIPKLEAYLNKKEMV